jgi:Tfp pilus assembly protein PilF
MRENNPREAEKLLEDFLDRDPENIDVLLALAQIARYEKRLRDARTYLQNALEHEPTNPKVITELKVLDKLGP